MQNLAYDDNKIRYEILNGQIVYMSPKPVMNHLTVTGNIYNIFKNFLRGKKCIAYSDGATIHLDKIKNAPLKEKNKKDKLIPDVVVICNPSIIKYDGIYGTPDLVVEVLSPSTAKNDRTIKKNLYEAIGVKEYWIVDTKNRLIEVYILNDKKYDLDNIYHRYSEPEIKMIMEDEHSDKNIIKEFKTSLYDDLIIPIESVFEDLIEDIL